MGNRLCGFCISFGAIAASRSAFSPNLSLKRSELAVALASFEGVVCNDREEPEFTDTPIGSSYLGEVNWAVRNGIITGYSDGTFRPTNAITRQEFCVMMHRYITNYCEKTLPTSGTPLTYTDISSVASWARTAVNQLCWAGLFNGFEDNTFRPQDQIKRSEAASALTKIHGYIYIPDGSIAVFVKNSSGIAIKDAVMYVYKPNDNDPSSTVWHDMYPEPPALSDTEGIATRTELAAGTPYGINILHNTYGATVIPTLVNPSKMYYFAEVATRDASLLSSPADGFSSISKWPHTNSAICQSICPNNFTRICPDRYFNATYPQNFGWRYGEDYNVQFHQAIDVSYSYGTPLKNVFKNSARVLIAETLYGCGKTVHLQDLSSSGLYATYMHLSDYVVTSYSNISAGTTVGYVGNTGTNATHLHFSIEKSNIYAADSTDSTEITQFTDPLCYLN